ncbi:hypothetical protein FO519_009220 [Halicephalobus sp. NKZ332]|nr:hypothetical protein FO519_009220 [Halicephalobus sp. NKZ332]
MASVNPSSEEEYFDYKLPESFEDNFSITELALISDELLNLPNIPLFDEDDFPSTSQGTTDVEPSQNTENVSEHNPPQTQLDIGTPHSPESGYNSDCYDHEHRATALNQGYHHWSPETSTSPVFQVDQSQSQQLIYNQPYYPVCVPNVTFSRKRASSTALFDDMNFGKRPHLVDRYQYVEPIPQVFYQEIPQAQPMYYSPPSYPSHVLPASEVPSFEQITANLDMSHRRHPAQRQPSDSAMLLDLNRTKLDRWQPTIAFLKQCLGEDRLIEFVCELLETSGKCNTYVQWLSETSSIKSPRCFELKNTAVIAQMYSQKIGQHKSYKSMSNILSAGNWSWNGIVLLKKVSKNQRNKYELIPDLVYSSFGGHGNSRIELGPDGRLMEVLTNM